MSEVIVTDTGETPLEASSAHDAAVAEGAAAVHSDAAEQASDEARAAAESALAATAANLAAAESAAESAARAEDAEARSQITMETLHEAVVTLGGTVTSALEEIRASRKETKPAPAEPVEHKTDEAPKPKTPKRRGFIVR